MKVVGLLSGGKDSCYNLLHCVKNGHQLVALATLSPPQRQDELDSYMYQTVGHDAVHLVAEAMQLPLYRHIIRGTAIDQGADFGSQLRSTAASSSAPAGGKDETEDLYELLQQVKQQHPDVEAVSVGAILSNYQRVRVENIALRPELNLVPLTYLWQRDQDELLNEMVHGGLHAVLIKCAGIGLTEKDLAKSLAQLQPKLRQLVRAAVRLCAATFTDVCAAARPIWRTRLRRRRRVRVVDARLSALSQADPAVSDPIFMPTAAVAD